MPVLRAGLAAALEGNELFPMPLVVLERKLPPMMSTFPNETVTCRFANGRKRRLFIKYEAGRNHDAFGHRGGVAYEAKIYHNLLSRYPDFRPRCLGAHAANGTDETWLVLEYLDRCVRVSDICVKQESRQPVAMAKSAQWIGWFHAAHERVDANEPPRFLIRYNERYFEHWCRRAARLTRPLHRQHPWLPKLCSKQNDWLNILMNARKTIVHGEFYAKTLMFGRDNVFPVDWESTAIGPGEIDLAALTEGNGWPERIVAECVHEYQQARWPEAAPPEFRQILDAARIYLHFRWLGEREDWTFGEKNRWRYGHLRATSERVGLI
jgi:hypothetical protein